MSRVNKTFSIFVAAAALVTSLALAGGASADLIVYRCGDSVAYDICTVDPDHAEESVQNLTETDYTETQPTWSPDGKLLSFIGDYPGKTGLYVTDPAVPGEATEVLENGGGYAAWSPDGSRIAAEVEEPPHGLHAVVFPSDGTGTPHAVGLDNVSEVHPNWSADGNTIAFAHANAVYTAPADGSGEAKVLPGGIGNEIAWSPDGTWIAAISASNEVVRIIAANGSGTTITLPVKAELASSISWSPDSKSVTYINDSDRVWVAPIEGAGFEIPMPTGAIVPHEPVISPDGTRIAYDADPNVAGEMDDQLYVAPSNGRGEGEKITKSAWSNAEPDWKPIPGAVKPPPEPGKQGANTGGGEKRQPQTIKFASYHHPAVYNQFVTGVYVTCSLGSTQAVCADHGEGGTAESPIGVRPRAFARSKPKPVVVVKGSVKVPDGKKKELPLKLTPAGRKLLDSGRALKIKLVITQTAPGFETEKTTTTIEVKPPHKPSKH